jgi:hypothetical protein
MEEIHVNLLTQNRLLTKEEGATVLGLICNVYPELAPERFGNYEPVRQAFDPTHPEEALKAWEKVFLWTRKRPKVEGGAWIAWGPRPIHGLITLSIDKQKVDIEKLTRFVQIASTSMDTDFAFMHIITERDLPIGGATKTIFCLDPKRNRYNLLVTTHDLRKYIPDLYWATVFGPPYVKHFGRERLLSSPAPIVRELENRSIYIQLSDSPFDLETDGVHVDTVRREVKEHLNKNSFFDPAAPADHVYSVPEFHLG